MDDDLEPRNAHELIKDFENGMSIIFENLNITSVFRLRRRCKGKIRDRKDSRNEAPEVDGSDRSKLRESPRESSNVLIAFYLTR